MRTPVSCMITSLVQRSFSPQIHFRGCLVLARPSSHFTRLRGIVRNHTRSIATEPPARKPPPLAAQKPGSFRASPKPKAQGTGSLRRPHAVVIYHAGTGKIAFIGMMRMTTIILFVVSCTVIAPAFALEPSAPTYLVPLIVLGGAFPMVFVSYTTGPFVNQVVLVLPRAAKQSADIMNKYLRNISPETKLSIETMKFNFWPRRTEVAVKDLALVSSKLRPVTFRHTRPKTENHSWWDLPRTTFFAPINGSKGKRIGVRYHPEIWPRIWEQIDLVPAAPKLK